MENEQSEENGEEMMEDEPVVALTPEELKEAGNNCYKQQDYVNALNFYSQAIQLCPTCAVFYGNRAATYIMLDKFSEALDDAKKSTQLDSTFLKGYLREAKCHLALEDTPAAIRLYTRVLSVEPENAVAKRGLAVAEVQKKLEIGRELDCIEQRLIQAPNRIKFKIQKAKALMLLGRYQESQELSNDILQRDGMNADAVFVRGMCLYYQDSIDKAFQHFQQVLRLAPDHQKAKDIYRKAKQLIAKKEEGNAQFRSGKFQEAYNIYTEALHIDPNNKFTNSKLYTYRATVCSKMGKGEQAIEDCTKAIELDDTYLKAYMRRAKCYMDAESNEEAVRDYEKAVRGYKKIFQMDQTRDNKRLVEEAKLELKKSKWKDYYKILGVVKSANKEEIKKGYLKRAKVHHPDRHPQDTPEVLKEEEKKFKEVGEAYAVLSDKKKRRRYDQGHGQISKPIVIGRESAHSCTCM